MKTKIALAKLVQRNKIQDTISQPFKIFFAHEKKNLSKRSKMF